MGTVTKSNFRAVARLQSKDREGTESLSALGGMTAWEVSDRFRDDGNETLKVAKRFLLLFRGFFWFGLVFSAVPEQIPVLRGT